MEFIQYQIYQCCSDFPGRFLGLAELRTHGLSLCGENYRLVYSGKRTPPQSIDYFLEELFMCFSTEAPPVGFAGWMMSTSDVVVVNSDGKRRAFFCDSIEFKEVPSLAEKIDAA